jgi:hypothetical protein
MDRQDYMVELATPRRAAAGPVRTRADVEARRKLIRQLRREFERELEPLRAQDPKLRVWQQNSTVIPLLIINTVPMLRSSIEGLKSVGHVYKVPRMGLIR